MAVMGIAERVRQSWKQFDFLPEEVNILCLGCGKSGEYCRGVVERELLMAGGKSLPFVLPPRSGRYKGAPAGMPACCAGCRHWWGMVHRRTGLAAPAFDSPEARRMMYDIIDLTAVGAVKGIGPCIRRLRKAWQERTGEGK